MAITQITTRDTQLEKQRLGRDVTMIENDGGTLKVSVGSVIECSGAIYEVMSAAETPTGSPADGTYLFFDPAGPSFAWSATAGTYDAAKGASYDGSDRRQCRFILISAILWKEILSTEPPGAIMQGPFATERLHQDGATEDNIYDALSPFLPNIGDMITISGAIAQKTPGTETPSILSYAERTTASQIKLYGLRSAEPAPLTMYAMDDGDTSESFYISIAW